MSKDTTNKETIEGDREVISVAQNTDYTKISIIALVLLCGVGILFVALDGMNKNQPKSMVEPESTLFKTAASSINAPYIEEKKPEPKQLKEAAATPAAPEHSAFEIHMAQEALRRAKEAEAEMRKRRASPQIIFENNRSQVPVAISDSSLMPASGSLMGGDPNIAFANQYSNADVNIAKATKMQHLHALVAQGNMIDGILETAIQSDLPGMVRAIVSKNTYSFDGTTLLIPKGSRLIGRYNSGLVRGQSRVFVIWNRLIRPDGVSINIGSYGTDNLGRSGLGGIVDTKFFERFGSSVLLSLIDAGIQVGVNAVDNDTSATVAMNSGQDFSRAAEIALENTIAIKPTVHIHQGTEIKVFVGRDLDFSSLVSR